MEGTFFCFEEVLKTPKIKIDNQPQYFFLPILNNFYVIERNY